MVISSGVLMVNLSHAHLSSFKELFRGALPVLAAAFCYPVGNQMVWEAFNVNASLPDSTSIAGMGLLFIGLAMFVPFQEIENL